MRLPPIVLSLIAFFAVVTGTSLARANTAHVTFKFASGELHATATMSDTTANTTHLEFAGWPAFTSNLIDSFATSQAFAVTIEMTRPDGKREVLYLTTSLAAVQVQSLSLSYATTSTGASQLVEKMDLATPRFIQTNAPLGTTYEDKFPNAAGPAVDSAYVNVGGVETRVTAATLTFSSATMISGMQVMRRITATPLTFTEAGGTPVSTTLQQAQLSRRDLTPTIFSVGSSAGLPAGRHNDSYRWSLGSVQVASFSSQLSGGQASDAVTLSWNRVSCADLTTGQTANVRLP